MKCKNCKCKVDKTELVINWINYFCSNKCSLDYITYLKQNKKPLTQRKAIKKISSKRKERLKDWWSELELFREIWNERKRECEVCKKTIYEASSFCFAHQAPKGTYPEHRLNKDNISLVCSIKCHWEIDKLFSWIKRQEHIKKLTCNKSK